MEVETLKKRLAEVEAEGQLTYLLIGRQKKQVDTLDETLAEVRLCTSD